MSGRILALLATLALGVGSAYAQDGAAGAGRFEIGAFPGGAMFFTESGNGNEPDFGNYALGASVTFNVNRRVGIEGEGGGTLGIRQNFISGSTPFADQRTPGMWTYSGNIVLSPHGSDRAFVPYATGGIGGLTMCPCGEVEALGITAYETYLTGNAGAGLKWFSSRRFGVRGDYRFFGNENRYGHRVQAGLIFTY